jgi:hypothetical protein
LLDWLGATTFPELVAQMSTRLDAVLEFTIFVAREFLLRNYSLEKHQSDVFDSETYARAARLLPSPTDLLPGWATGVSEVSRFSCMKFLGVSGVFD